MISKPNIDILLATYNGDKYLREQIESILAQTNKGWKLIIRDDGSQDNTQNIIEGYIAKYPNKIKQVSDENYHLGASLNFGRLLEHSEAEYIMFSDQDDIWLPSKLERTLSAMKSAERIYSDKPILIHTDLKVIDSDANIISDSMWCYQKLISDIGDDVKKIMIQNVVTGCTVMINKKAKTVSIPIPKEAVMYDWWIAINVAKYGKIIGLSESLILYRQHSSNRIGSQKKDLLYFLKKVANSKTLLSAQYKMVKNFEPDISFFVFLLKKVSFVIVRMK